MKHGMVSNFTNANFDALLDYEIADLPGSMLSEIQERLAAELVCAKHRVARLNAALSSKYKTEAREVLRNLGKNNGTAILFDGEAVVEAAIDHEIEWNQIGLGDLALKIGASGVDPDLYVKRQVVFSVHEDDLQKWPAEIRDAFIRYRTTKPGKETYKVSVRE